MSKPIVLNVKVGNDNGNSEHDIIINGKLIQQPNVMAKVRKLPDLSELNTEYVIKNIESNLITSIVSPSCETNTYYIGDYARNSGKMLKNIEVGAFNSKLNSDVIVVNTLSQIAGYAVQKAYEVNSELNNSIIVNVDMTTALPVTQYNKENAKLFIDKFMKDKHNVTVHIGNIKVNVIINFEYVKVLPESVPVVFYLQSLNKNTLDNIENEEEKNTFKNQIKLMFNEFNKKYKLNIDGNYFKDKKILHISIGEGTTEYPLTEDIKFNPNFIEGSNNGTGHAINQVLNEFIQMKYLTKLTRQDFSAILKDKNHKYYQDAIDIVEEPLEEQAEVILRYAKSEIGKANNDVDIICVNGGGSILMKEYLYNELIEFGNATNIKLFYVPEEFAVKIEALGMYAFTNSKIFEMLKNKYKEVAITKN